MAEIRAEKGRKRATNRQLADAAGFTPETLRMRNAGKPSLNLDELAGISSFLEVPAWELVKRAEDAA